MLAAFLLWTAAVLLVDVQTIGPQDTVVGLAAINHWFHQLTGVHMRLYVLTDWLGLIPLGIVTGFALLGLAQWIRRKHLLRVDGSLLVLGGFYIVVLALYMLFEIAAVNVRPVLIDGQLEASYPSSTTLMVLCVMPTAIMQLRSRIKNRVLNRCVTVMMAVFLFLMVVGRLISGVHWLSDIIGSALLSAGLVMMYRYVVSFTPEGRE